MAVVLEKLTKHRDSASDTLSAAKKHLTHESVEEAPINPSNIEYDDLLELRRMLSGLAEKMGLLEYKENISQAALRDLCKAASGKNAEMPKELPDLKKPLTQGGQDLKKRLTQRIQNLDDNIETHQEISKKIQERVEEARIYPSNIQYVDLDELKSGISSLDKKIGLFEHMQDLFIIVLRDLCKSVIAEIAEMPEELEAAKKCLRQHIQSLVDKRETFKEISKNIRESAEKARINPSNIEYNVLDELKSMISDLVEKVGLLSHKKGIFNASLCELCKVAGVNNAKMPEEL